MYTWERIPGALLSQCEQSMNIILALAWNTPLDLDPELQIELEIQMGATGGVLAILSTVRDG